MPTLENLFSRLESVKVIDDSISYSQYTPINLSVSNVGLSKIDMENAGDFETYVEISYRKMKQKSLLVATMKCEIYTNQVYFLMTRHGRNETSTSGWIYG